MSDRSQSYAQQQSAQRDEIAVIVNTIDKQERKYADILPRNVKWADFRNAFLIAVQGNQRLLDADRQSLWLALQKAASSGLKPDGQESALVIFGDDQEDEDGNPVPSAARGKKKVVFMPMIAGLIKTVRNTGNVASIRAKLVYKGESWIESDVNGIATYKHERNFSGMGDIDDTPGNIIGAYAVINYKDGFWEMEAMSRGQIDRVRAISRSKKGPWLTWPDEMAKKTVLRRLIKRVERSAELYLLDSAITQDETLGTEIEGRATEQIDNVRAEFSSDRQAQSTVQQQATERRQDSGQQQQVEQHLDGQDEEKKPAPAAKKAAAEKKPDEQAPKATPEAKAEPQQQDGFDHFALDEVTGEPVEDSAGQPMHFKNAGSFALWYVVRSRASTNPMALEENNADALEEVRQHKAAGLILDTLKPVMAEETKKAEAKQEAPEAAKPAVVADPHLIPMPLLPNNKMNLPKYCLLVEAALKKIKTEAHLNDWITGNTEVMAKVPSGGAYGIKLDALVKTRAEQVRVEDPPQPTPAPPPMDMDEQRTMDLTAELNAVTTEHEYDAIIRRETTKALARRLTQERPELRKIIADADTVAFRRVKTRPEPKQQVEEPPHEGSPPSDDEIPWDRINEGPPADYEGH